MKKTGFSAKVFTRQNLIRLILLVFGFTLFPAVVYWSDKLIFHSSPTLSEFYAKIFGSLMDLGMDGMFAWCVVCTPYLAYDIFLVVQDYRGQRVEAGKNGMNDERNQRTNIGPDYYCKYRPYR